MVSIFQQMRDMMGWESEPLTRFKAVIQSDHAYIHKGIAFTYVGNTGELAAGSAYTVAFTTPLNRHIHLRPTLLFSSANAAELRIAEASTVTGGTPVTARNRNRSLERPPLGTIAVGVTLSAEGTVLDAFYAGAQRVGGGGDGAQEELLLEDNTTYSFRFSNIGAATATTIYYRLFWYEEGRGE